MEFSLWVLILEGNMDKEMEGETLTYAANLIDEAKDK